MSLDNLPVEWLLTSIENISEVIAGGTPKANDPENFVEPPNGIGWLTPADLSGYSHKYIGHGKRDLSEKGYKSSSAKLIPKGSVVFSSRAPIGYVAIASNEISTNQGFKNFVIDENISSEYLYYYLKRIRDLAESLGTGTTFKELSGSACKKLPFVLAPLAEQQEIVRQLDVMLAQVEQIKTRLDAIPAILKKFRQSVLADAVSGKLTGMDISDWTEVTVNDLVNIVNGKAFPSSDYAREGIKLLRPGNLHMSGKVIWTDKNTIYLPKEWKEKRPELLLKKGALLMNLTAQSLADEFLGRVCILEDADEDILLNQRISSFESKINYDVKPYLFYFFKSPQFRSYVDTLDTGTLIKHLNVKDIKSYRFRLPPENEQRQIVNLLKTFMQSASGIEEAVVLAKKRVNLLTQSILAKAFSGELTAEWREQHSDLITGVNSAEALLAKIQAEREASKPAKKTRKKKEV